MKKAYFVLVLICTYVMPTLSQVVVTAPAVKAVKGNIFSTGIHVKSLDSLAALQFTLQWDPSVLAFQQVDSLTYASAFEAFNVSRVSEGILRFFWFSTQENGVVPKDSARFFKLMFKAIGNGGQSSSITFSNTPLAIKALNPSVKEIQVKPQNGMVEIQTTSAIGEVSDGNGQAILYQNKPNPVSSSTLIPLELKESSSVTLNIVDMGGRVFIEKKMELSAGRHEIPIYTEGVLPRGIFQYTVKTKFGILNKTLIKI